ncbi:putative DeoR family transcriptional regulator, stage III sporulation protein D [Anaerocolumna jejuensis DSM 15929]|uniref:Putative DeoR family transcriptional regulator, stage III sporulation protein D n=1 Tax=Anaerocolumna jejuensis DSM 15929 TaxID=1121322 RepID=A0A1M7AZK6_9FIRM|nr:sporulation transcriptional regulator SpoIIID [Anaerocolumna jejuensis]SHL48067.1 putative DeoR family transcriptional regulator, stage III sporulation protein D [Anaerocolumna jejuensis DSM 15929]
MHPYMEERIIELANYTIEQKATVRETAIRYGVSKSTVHKDLQDRLPLINKQLYHAVNEVLMLNKAERHIRGGLATRRKYKKT